MRSLVVLRMTSWSIRQVRVAGVVLIANESRRYIGPGNSVPMGITCRMDQSGLRPKCGGV